MMLNRIGRRLLALAGLMLLPMAIPPARAATIKIVAIGASTTAGNKVGIDLAYPAQLQAMLRAKGYDVDIQNEGVSGATSASMVGWADSVPSDTRLVLLQIAPSNDGRHGITAAQTAVYRNTIVQHLKARHIRVVFVNRHVSRHQLALDGKHPNADGQRTIAARLLPQVVAAIGSRR
ncbi:MAG TPA: GDSL-type esterase/lipase family protein [Nitrobacter sp.]|jgi:acyl-CoA thioesterase-1|nr:GDSL-type esterase/lipase family protein [Nitrobacter sp.]